MHVEIILLKFNGKVLLQVIKTKKRTVFSIPTKNFSHIAQLMLSVPKRITFIFCPLLVRKQKNH